MSVIGQHEMQSAARALLGTIPELPDAAHTAWDNRGYEPTTGVPWKKERLVLMDSFRVTDGPIGINRDEYAWMLDLYYPLGSDILARSLADQALRTAFFIGRTVLVRAPWYFYVDGYRMGSTQEDTPNWSFLPVVMRLVINGPAK
jgi:hypothetical protein